MIVGAWGNGGPSGLVAGGALWMEGSSSEVSKENDHRKGACGMGSMAVVSRVWMWLGGSEVVERETAWSAGCVVGNAERSADAGILEDVAVDGDDGGVAS